jgi:hypothetical protein
MSLINNRVDVTKLVKKELANRGIGKNGQW